MFEVICLQKSTSWLGKVIGLLQYIHSFHDKLLAINYARSSPELYEEDITKQNMTKAVLLKFATTQVIQ